MIKQTVLAVFTPKGGVAKTTTAFNLAHECARIGVRTLIVVADPQRDLLSLAVEPGSMRIPVRLEHVLIPPEVVDGWEADDDTPHPTKAIYPIGENIDIMPALNLRDAESRLNGQSPSYMRLMLDKVAEEKSYELVIVDLPPTPSSPIVMNAMVAADGLISPMKPEAGVLTMLPTLVRFIDKEVRFARRTVPEYTDLSPLEVVGILPTMYDGRTREHRACVTELTERFGDDVHIFDPIPNGIAVAEARRENAPLYKYAPKHRCTIAYRKMSSYVLDWLLDYRTDKLKKEVR